MKVNLALFGAGRIGAIHGHNALKHPQANLVALHDPFKANEERLADELGCQKMTPEAIFANAAIDAILICSATDTHADLIEQAAAAGKHVFCEKPIDLSLARVQQCIERVAGTTSRIMVAFNRRFDPSFQALQQRINQGEIGKVELISIISKDPSPPPVSYINVSGGLFRDMTIHDFDMARFLLGEEIASVSAEASCLVDTAIAEAGDVDTAVINMTSVSGKLVQISNSRRASFGYDQRIEVHGSTGMLVGENITENTVISYTEKGKHSAKPLYFFLERYQAAYQQELDSFIRRLRGEDLPLPGIHDGLKALQIAEAAIQALETGKRVYLDDEDC